jgi:hypothetical protein
MSEYRFRLARHRFDRAQFRDGAAPKSPGGIRVLVLGFEARNSSAAGFVDDVGWYALRNDTNEYRAGRGRYWGTGHYPRFWTIAHRVVFESWRSPVRGPGAAIRRWFDQHPLGSPIAFADVSPVHSDAGTGAGNVPCEMILRHLSNLADVASRSQIRPELVIYPPVAHFRKGSGFDAERIREGVQRLANHSYETKFFGRDWRRGEKLPDETVQLTLRHALRDWNECAG